LCRYTTRPALVLERLSTNGAGQVVYQLNAAALGRIDEAHAAILEARRLQPNFSQAMVQKSAGVSRPEIDARRNAALRKAGLD
jgi:hypothetical protein